MMPIFAWNVPLVSLIFLKRSLVFPILLFSSISFHWSLRKAFLPLLGILWNSAFRWVYISFFSLFLLSLIFSAICKAYWANCFALFHCFFLGIVLIMASRTMSWTSLHSSFNSVQFSSSVMSDSLQPHELQHARPPCPSPTPRIHSNPRGRLRSPL